MITKVTINDVTLVVIGSPDEEVPAPCSDCGQMDELRPYGRDAAMVCFHCAMKDPDNAQRMFQRQIRGDS